MRYLRAIGILLPLATLLVAMALQINPPVQVALLICLAAMAVCFAQRPAERATMLAPAVCFVAAALALLAQQADDPFIMIEMENGLRAVPAGESAYRTLGACLYALLAGLWLGETASEALIGKAAFGVRAGWAGAPVRICAFLCALVGMAACAVPGLTEWVAIPVSVQAIIAMCGSLATGALTCYIASARAKAAAGVALVLYLACAVFDPTLFARHAFFALAFSVLLCGRCNGKGALLCLVPVPLALATVWFYRVDGSALSLYAERLSQAMAEFFQPGGLDWILPLYARFGVYGFAFVGVLAGVFLFLLGRLLRDSFLYAAPAMFVLGWGCMVLMKGPANLPGLADAVFFAVVYGLCLIVGCIRRASGRHKRSSKPITSGR